LLPDQPPEWWIEPPDGLAAASAAPRGWKHKIGEGGAVHLSRQISSVQNASCPEVDPGSSSARSDKKPGRIKAVQEAGQFSLSSQVEGDTPGPTDHATCRTNNQQCTERIRGGAASESEESIDFEEVTDHSEWDNEGAESEDTFLERLSVSQVLAPSSRAVARAMKMRAGAGSAR
jgi:hypothetical protein